MLDIASLAQAAPERRDEVREWAGRFQAEKPDHRHRRLLRARRERPGDSSASEERDECAAGAILNDSGEMIGSAIFADFQGAAALDAWLDRGPYDKQNVWQKIEVKPFRLAILDGKITP